MSVFKVERLRGSYGKGPDEPKRTCRIPEYCSGCGILKIERMVGGEPMIQLYDFQKEALQRTEQHNRCAYYLDMGLGKTFVGSEKLISFGTELNLLICQKSKVADWMEHFRTYYRYDISAYDLTTRQGMEDFIENPLDYKYRLGIINYELTFDYKAGLTDGIRIAVDLTEKAPTSDPVKHGQYIEAMSGVMHVYPDGQVMCSVCKQRMPLMWKKMPPYCFGCGAKMDGEPQERQKT